MDLEPDVPLALITNMNHVIIHGMHLHTHALLLVQHDALRGKHYTLHGYCTNATLPTFDLDVPSKAFVIFRPDAIGPSLLCMTGMQDIALHVSRAAEPIDVCRFDPCVSMEHAERLLTWHVAKYWTAPYMPLPNYLPIDEIRNSPDVRGH